VGDGRLRGQPGGVGAWWFSENSIMTHDWGKIRPPIKVERAPEAGRNWLVDAIIVVLAFATVVLAVSLLSGCATWDHGSMNTGANPQTSLSYRRDATGGRLDLMIGQDTTLDCNSLVIPGNDGSRVEMQGFRATANASSVRSANVAQLQAVGQYVLPGQAQVVQSTGQAVGYVIDSAGRALGQVVLPGQGAAANKPASLIDTARAKIMARVELAIERKLTEALDAIIPGESLGPTTQPGE
jgi:hypothetical protein